MYCIIFIYYEFREEESEEEDEDDIEYEFNNDNEEENKYELSKKYLAKMSAMESQLNYIQEKITKITNLSNKV